MRFSAMTVLIALAVCAPAHAGGRDANPFVPGAIAHENDVAMVFDYLREVVSAAAEGRAAPPPAALAERAEAIGEDLKRRGAAAAHALIDALESSVRESLREPPRRAPAPAPGQIRL